jgi:hypothetical protein
VVNIARSQKVERAETNDAGMTVRYVLPRTGPQKSLLRPRCGLHPIPDSGVGGYEGRCIRSGPPSQFVFDDQNPEPQTDEFVDVCSRLERMSPECGPGRVADSELVVRVQCMIIELVGGSVAETILHPDQPSLGAKHDHVEAAAFARVACAAGASPAVAALISYAEAEALALLSQNLDILKRLVEELIEAGILSGEQIDEIISAGVTVHKSCSGTRPR